MSRCANQKIPSAYQRRRARGPRTQVREEEPKQKTPSTDPHHFPSQVQTSAYTPRSPYQHAGEGGRAPTPVHPSPLTR